MRVQKSIVMLLIVGSPAASVAQNAASPTTIGPAHQQRRGTDQQGRVADSTAGKIGERKTRDNVAGNQPSMRIASRVQNRVSSRIYSRIDRYYQSGVDTASPFAEAEQETRNTSRRPKR